MAAGASTNLWETTTFSTWSPKISFKDLAKDSNSASSFSLCAFSSSVSSNSKSLVMSTNFLSSNSFNWVKAYSSIGSTKNKTSKFLAFKMSKNGDFSTAFKDSPVM
ncbi:hypothetical protein WICPIJ_006536 [Wickerhamomyces pijperi]|uniref:Uncharacterized protein n=1 Tax=Wickerhamomyces pijperi TaxID=599730 RepID=A0A9P8TLB2_WICPI|nr:hypothetical protein WICPIJ_006536 [Wickerhamomyces pijperi]